jgi:hypothetical protein
MGEQTTRLGIACALAVSVAAGCTILTSLDGLSSGGDAGLRADGASEAAADAAVADAASPMEGGDAGGTDAGFCASSTDLEACEDFDTAPSAAFENVTGPASQTLDTATSASAPRSLRIETSALVAGKSTFAYRRASAAVTPSTRRITSLLALSVDQAGTGGLIASDIRLVDGAGSLEVHLVVSELEANIEELRARGGPAVFAYHKLSKPVPTGRFVRVQLDVELDNAAVWTVTVLLDGETVLSHVPLTLWNTTGAFTARAGSGVVYIQGPATPWNIHVDDIGLNVEPKP